MSSIPGLKPPAMRATRMRLHAQHQPIALMRADCHVSRSEGLSSRSQVLITADGREVQALLYQVDSELLAEDEVALSEDAWDALGIADGAIVQVRHPPVLESLAGVRQRIYGRRLGQEDMTAIVRDVVRGRYTDVHLSAFLTATATLPLSIDETIFLTRAMVDVGGRLSWDAPIVVDKHCVGGLPGNRTTPLVVAIAAANGLVMPKTSSRAITSPAGTADTMEMLAPVDLSIEQLQQVVRAEGGCVAWGGAMHLSPADDIFVRVERELDIDTEGQLIASVLSKKIAAGATHVVIDIPIGPTAKVRSREAAERLAAHLTETASHFGLALRCLYTDGSQPVGQGIGPALEARDVLAVLRNEPGRPQDLRERAALVAGAVLELGGAAPAGQGEALALRTLDSGLAWEKFARICAAQGGLREPPQAAHVEPLVAPQAGRVVHIDNRKLSRLAKLAGAPERPAAGVSLRLRLGDEVSRGQPWLFLHAQTRGEMAYALEYARHAGDIITIQA
ncbi:thymidine phosphorylase family protein [Bordetella pseudohinzii]|uniref:Putative thymidine phosphorylase n=1 Tax=Bordetella pseudohinzii TaxID=1331258 RepID=A0A0J6C968_9BORD|nr:thymidine phosphorylase family protein [Bordetella pseudohinzii]ANY14924.1 thymidine phosphorylase [Bordetella pseudohinzii]KMM25952.1 thymidine phosphorylase [Bordetella pseudohinzii]KXA76492.1 thymidine phosphorylase [Bordetella pseudohinzii]KXA79281.1 thymidine phosphorylase [Bordetella pseudohinzii]CUI94872.1 Pyrimidine-nucleoside phosphorylase [Bordetella pseudohinzii]